MDGYTRLYRRLKLLEVILLVLLGIFFLKDYIDDEKTLNTISTNSIDKLCIAYENSIKDVDKLLVSGGVSNAQAAKEDFIEISTIYETSAYMAHYDENYITTAIGLFKSLENNKKLTEYDITQLKVIRSRQKKVYDNIYNTKNNEAKVISFKELKRYGN